MPNFAKATKEVVTAKLNSIGSSGGTTEVMIKVHFNNNLYLFTPSSYQLVNKTYPDAANAKINKNKINNKLSVLFAVTLSVENSIVLINLPWFVSNPVRSTNAIAPLSGGFGKGC